MPAARDISMLSLEEQQKILRAREAGRKCARGRQEKIKLEREARYKRLREMDKDDPRWQAVLSSNRRFKKNNPEKIRAYEQKALTNIQHKLRRALRSRLRQALKKTYRSGSAVADLGCSIEFLKIHLENSFSGEMTWDNYGAVWHIDHIKPLASFDLTDRSQFLTAVHYTNLQPLLAADNLSKGAKQW